MSVLRSPQHLAGLLALSTVVGCGSSSLLKHKKGSSAPATDPTATASNAQPTGPQVTLQLTANYKMRPVDVLIIRDGDSHGYPMDGRINAALPLLTARLWNLTANVGYLHVGVFDHYLSSDNQDPNKPQLRTETPIVDPGNGGKVLFAENLSAVDFDKDLTARVVAAGTRGGDPRPATVLSKAYAEAQKPGGGDVTGLFRSDAYWSVLYISAHLNPNDPLDQSDIATLLKGHTAGYQISTLAIDKNGCNFANITPTQMANPKSYTQRNLEIKMQEMTQGVVGSMCANTFTLFMDDFVQKGTGTQYFPAQLPSPIQASSIKITSSSGTAVQDFRYVTGSKELEVSTLIPSGQSFTVQANSDGDAAGVTTGTVQGDPSVPTATP